MEKNMKKRIAAFIMVGVFALSFAGCGSSKSESQQNADNIKEKLEESVAAIKDAVVKHEVYHSAEGNGYNEYAIVFYGGNTGTLKGLTYQTKFDETSGVTVEEMESQNLDEIYPGFSEMSFADARFTENGDTVDAIIRFMDLDDYDNLKMMDENGLMALDDPNKEALVDASILMERMEQAGAEKLSLAEYGDLNLDFSID